MNALSSESARFGVRVPPRMCDAQGMVHAARYHEVLEDAFLDWLDAIGSPYTELRSTGIDLVIGTSTIRHRAPARLGDTLHISVERVRSSRSTITIRFTITRAETEAVAEAEVTYISVHEGTATPLPAELAGDERLTEQPCDS